MPSNLTVLIENILKETKTIQYQQLCLSNKLTGTLQQLN